jgi:hypothetical protein
MQQHDKLFDYYNVVFHYGFNRSITVTIRANDRYEALRIIDEMIDNKDPLIPEGYLSWILESI